MKKPGKAIFILLCILMAAFWAGCSKKPPQSSRLPAADPAIEHLQWDSPPPITIDPAKIYLATIKTEVGDIQIELFADKTLLTVNNFIFLAREKYYDNSTFHMVLSDFKAQAGKPAGEVVSGPGYNIQDEILEELTFNDAGYLAMSNLGQPNTGGSQFFINLSRTLWLNGKFTIFGKVVAGMDVVLALKLRNPDIDQFAGTKIFTVEISEIPASLLPEKKLSQEIKAPVLTTGRPLAKLPVAEREFIYNAKPAMVIDPAKSYAARVVTTKGTIDVKLRPDLAPESVNNFYILAKLGYWDNFPFTNVLRARYALTGSPGAKPASDIGYAIPKEANPDFKIEIGKLGYWAYASLDGSSSGSNIYFMMTNDPRGHYATVFGEISAAGMEVVKQLATDDEVAAKTKQRELVIRIDIIE